MASHKLLKFWPLFFLLTFIEGASSLFVLMRIPSEGGGLLGFSVTRLLVMAGLALVSLAALWTGLRARRDANWCELWLYPQRRPRLYSALSGASLVVALACGIGLFLLRYADPQRLLPFFERVRPLLLFLLVFSIQSALWLTLLRSGFHPEAIGERWPVYRAALLIFLSLLLVFVFVAVTRLGLTPDPAYWGEPGVPIQGWQAALALLAGGGMILLGLSLTSGKRKPAPAWEDALLASAVWGLAVVLWLGVPLEVLRNSFYAPITPPTGQPFPFSDAGYYDYMAQSLLLGNGFMGEIPPRPLYITFLAGLHALFGQRYSLIIAAQTVVLALFPMTLYFLGARLYSRAAGVTVALLAIFRELTTLWVSSETRVSNSKILLTDLPTALALAAICLLCLRWLERKDSQSALLTGGTFGLLLLLRTQSLMILPLLFLVAWLAFRPRWRGWALALLFFGAGMLAATIPWLTRNRLLTGKFTFDDPSQLAIIASQYSFEGNLDLSRFDFQSQSLARILVDFTVQNPGFVAGFVANHFLATEIGGLLALPLIERFDGLFAPVNLYWLTWDGSLAWYNTLLLILYLALIALGLGAAWARLRWVGMLPLAFNLGYALANGVARFSGWRYDLPADWVAYFYFAIGAMEILCGLGLLFGATRERLFTPLPLATPGPALRFPRAAALLTGFLLVGALPWIVEAGIPTQMTPLSSAALEERLATQSGIDIEEIRLFDAQPGTAIVYGRLLYPRYYRRGLGMSATNPWPVYQVLDYKRVGFVVIHEGLTNIILPVNRNPEDFPHGKDVIVLGCRRAGYVEARVVTFLEGSGTFTSGDLSADCTE